MRIGSESHKFRNGCRNVGQSEFAVCDFDVGVENYERNGIQTVRRTNGHDALFVLFKHFVSVAVVCRYDKNRVFLFNNGDSLASARSTASTPIIVASILPVCPTISPLG